MARSPIPSPSPFVSFARTPDELRREFVSDLHRRLHMLDFELKNDPVQTSKRAAALTMARRELEMLAEHWSRVTVQETRRKKREAPLADQINSRARALADRDGLPTGGDQP